MGAPFVLSPPERRKLQGMTRSRKRRVEDHRRARIVLELAAGRGVREVSPEVRTSANTVKLWRDRFLSERLGGLWSRHPGRQPRPGAEQLDARIIDTTLHKLPRDGSTHWSSRKLALHLATNQSRIARVWAKAGLQPHRLRRYMQSDDPDFEQKAADILGLYLKPPAMRRFLCG